MSELTHLRRSPALRLVSAVLCGLTWLISLLLAMGINHSPTAALAQGSTIRYVAPTGSDSGNDDCSDSTAPCATPQHAVDVASAGDEIRVATGVYTGVQVRLGLSQMVYISKTITLRGGYTPAFSSAPDPESNPTILDAQKQGRVLYLTGSISPTIEGLYITGGNGGIYISTARPTIKNNQIVRNSSGHGGGVIIYKSAAATLEHNTIISNTATGYSVNFGGGIYCLQSDNLILTANVIRGNLSENRGGGLYLGVCDNTKLDSNIISHNLSARGAGLYLDHSGASLTNNVVIDNQSTVAGGMFISTSSAHLLHTTIARNGGGGDDSGIYVTGAASYVTLTNTILVSHAVGITVAAGNTAALDGVLWHGSTFNTGGGGVISIANEYSGDPAFLNTSAGNYHLELTSAAIDKGQSGGVDYDIEGDPCPQGGGYDLGADETGLVAFKQANPSLVRAGALLTYTIRLTNTSHVDLHATVTDTLPPQATPTGSLTWTLPITARGGLWTQPVVITVAPGYNGILTNGVQVTTKEGATGAYTRTSKSHSPTLQLLGFQPSGVGYVFTLRLSQLLSHTQYVVSSYHHTDIDYQQDVITVTTDSAGIASAKVWSRCTVGNTLSGTVFARLTQAGIFQTVSNYLDCASLQTIDDFGSNRVADPANDDWIYRPSPPGSDSIRLWVRDAAGRSGLSGTIRIQFSQTGYSLPEQPLLDEGSGLYSYLWSPAGLPQENNYRAQLTLRDQIGGLSGLDAFIQLRGRATWVWGQMVGSGNPIIWAILTNEDYDNNGTGDRDEWLAFSMAPYGISDPSLATSYLSVFPYIGFNGTLVTNTVQSFLGVAHANDLRVEALAGTHAWVESAAGLQDGKDLCDAILDFNRTGTTPSQRFDGIHYDVEHDDWFAGNHWTRFIELMTYCQAQVDLYNQTHAPIVFGVDIPPHFLTGSEASGAVTSNWDVLSLVDYISLMDYRDFATVRWDGSRTDGIIPRAEAFVADGNALGKPIVIGVELTANRYDHVTFFEECPRFMEQELRQVSRHFAGEWAYQGLAGHDYAAWKAKDCNIAIDGPTTGFTRVEYTFQATPTGSITATLPLIYLWQATNQSHSITHSGNLSDIVTFTWNISGSQVVTVTATDGGSLVTNTHTITISSLVSPTGLAIAGPTTGTPNTSYDFTASVNPLSVTLPLSYAWQTGGQAPVTLLGALSQTSSFSWTILGPQTLIVTATNSGGMVTGTHLITISLPITVTKTANVSTADVGQTITYTYRLTNSGDVNLTSIMATDDKLGAIPLVPTTLAPDHSTGAVLTYTVVVTDLPGPLTNTVVVTGSTTGGHLVTASAVEAVVITDTTPPTFSPSPLITPTLGITVSTARPGFDWKDAVDNVGVVHYTLIITNDREDLSLAAVASVTRIRSSFIPTTDLPNAVYTWTVQAHDAAGNVSAFVNPQRFAINVPIRIYLPLVLKN